MMTKDPSASNKNSHSMVVEKTSIYTKCKRQISDFNTIDKKRHSPGFEGQKVATHAKKRWKSKIDTVHL